MMSRPALIAADRGAAAAETAQWSHVAAARRCSSRYSSAGGGGREWGRVRGQGRRAGVS